MRAKNPLHPLLIGIVPGQDHGRVTHRGPAARGNRQGPGHWALVAWRRRSRAGRRRRLLDEALIRLQPLGLIERHRRYYLSVFAVGGDKLGVIKCALGDHDLIGGGGHAHRLDVDAELTRPEGRHGHVREAGRREHRSYCGRRYGLARLHCPSAPAPGTGSRTAVPGSGRYRPRRKHPRW